LAQNACIKHGLRPKLVVITIGCEPLGKTHPDGQRRLQLFAANDRSWFSKTEAGIAHGIDVHEVDMVAETSTQELLREIRKHRDADGIQLMRPLPDGIDFDEVRDAVSLSQDVDGLHFGRACASPPATVEGIQRILEHYDVRLKGSRVVVIGRSDLLGQPLATMLTASGATVTLAHRDTEDLGSLCSAADLLICCVGSPRLVRSEWVKPGAVVLNVGTTSCSDSMIPDIPHFEELKHAMLVVRSVGPISMSMLLRNVAQKAAARPPRAAGADHTTPALTASEVASSLSSMAEWTLATNEDGIHVLKRDVHMPTYVDAVDFVNRATAMAEAMNHHPNFRLSHKCVDGAAVCIETFTYDLSALSKFDFDLATEIDQLLTI